MVLERPYTKINDKRPWYVCMYKYVRGYIATDEANSNSTKLILLTLVTCKWKCHVLHIFLMWCSISGRLFQTLNLESERNGLKSGVLSI